MRSILNQRFQEQNADESIQIDPTLLEEGQGQSKTEQKRLIRNTIDVFHLQYESLSKLFPKKPCDLPNWA